MRISSLMADSIAPQPPLGASGSGSGGAGASTGGAAASSGAADAPLRPRRKRSCLGTTIISFVDGGIFGATIGSIIASAQSVSGMMSGTETVRSSIMHVIRSGGRSFVSLGVALGSYSGGVCSLEKARGKKDVVNPFLVGGVLGALGSVQRVDVHDGQTMRRVLSASPRAMVGGSVSSGLLCSIFWYIQQPSRKQREQQEQLQQQQEQLMLQQEKLHQLQQQQKPAAVPLYEQQQEQRQAAAAAALRAQLDAPAQDSLPRSLPSAEFATLSAETVTEAPLSGKDVSGIGGRLLGEDPLPGRHLVEADLNPAALEPPTPMPSNVPSIEKEPLSTEQLLDPWANK